MRESERKVKMRYKLKVKRDMVETKIVIINLRFKELGRFLYAQLTI